MKLASEPIVLRITAIAVLLTCMFISVGEAYVCGDCGPHVTLQSQSGNPSKRFFSHEEYRNDRGIADQGRHSAGNCPVCLSPPLVVGSSPSVFLAPVDRVFQDVSRLHSGVPTPIYRPPRVAS